MALDIDGFAVFRSIGSHRDHFAAIATDLGKTARTLVVKQLRDKHTGLKEVRDIRTALGAETFNLIADGMADAQIKAVAVKLDKHNSELKTSIAAVRRHRLLALADGSAEPLEKQKSKSKPATPKKTRSPAKSTDRIQFSSAGATRKR